MCLEFLAGIKSLACSKAFSQTEGAGDVFLLERMSGLGESGGRDKPANPPSCLNDFFHRGHMLAQALANDFDRMRTNSIIDRYQFCVVNAEVS